VSVLEPLAVYDVAEANWLGLPHDKRQDLAAWLREQGPDPNDTYRLEVYLLDCLFVRVFQWDRDKLGGGHYCPLDHDHHDPDRSLCEAARRAPFDVPVAEMPPVKPWEAS